VTYFSERQLAGEFQSHHDHARDPEKENVTSRLYQTGRVELGQVSRLLHQHGNNVLININQKLGTALL
jgi:hypothetical protein